MSQTLNIFSKEKEIVKKESEKVIIDYREKGSLVPSQLKSLGMDIEFRELKVGDYLVKDVIIERKTISDFISSMINRRLIRQIEELKECTNPLIIIEGIEERELYSHSENIEKISVNPNAVRGFILSIALKHKIPLIFSKDSLDTAKFIRVLSKKEEREYSIKEKKKSYNKKEQQQFILESFPGIGPKTAKKLLEKFGSIKKIINSPKEDVMKLIGKKGEIIYLLSNNE